MPHPTAVILVVGLTEELLGDHAPNLSQFATDGLTRRLTPVYPAVTCSVQSSMLTGAEPREHGIVGNGWFDRRLQEPMFWKQSNRLVEAEKVWETARRRDSSVTTLNMFWWYNMYSSVETSVTPRPMYKADGRKVPDCYSEPPEIRDELQAELGQFPLFRFWGPAASIESSRWIADATRILSRRVDPTLTLVYLPHLDYALQKFGPTHASVRDEVAAIDTIVGELIEDFESRGVRVIILSEYGIEPVDRPIHLNRRLRDDGAIRVRVEDGLELLDPGASRAFAIADHQIAHVYVRDPADIDRFQRLVDSTPGVERAFAGDERREIGLDHSRSGDIVALAESGSWFSYYYWLDDDRAPDFARTVDIHRKPGYDPVELFLDPAIRFPKLAIGTRLLRKALGMRTLMDVIPLDATLVRGSHGRVDMPPSRRPLIITRRGDMLDADEIPCVAVRDVILAHLFEDD
ncbi:MAG: alkaline phosphatase family protein [Phycisphaerales bacterium]